MITFLISFVFEGCEIDKLVSNSLIKGESLDSRYLHHYLHHWRWSREGVEQVVWPLEEMSVQSRVPPSCVEGDPVQETLNL